MRSSTVIETFLERARRRQLANLTLDQASLAASFAMAGAILLLLLGTQILNWYWPVLLFAGALSFGLYRTRRRLSTRYQLAQQIDRRLNLKDALSTAYHFRDSAGDAHEFIRMQRAKAEGLAAGIDVRGAMPFRLPRTAYPLVGLVLIAGGMFGLRYGLTRSLNLQAPIAHFNFNPFRPDERKQQAASKKSVIQEKLDEQLKQMGMSVEQMEAQSSESDQVTDKTSNVLATPDGKNALPTNEKGQSTSEKGKPQEGDNVEGGENPESASAGNGKEPGSEDGSAGSPEQTGQQGKPQDQPSPGKGGANSSDSSSLANKMRDAVANLLSKLKPPSKGSDSQSASQQGNPQNGKSQQAMNQKGMQGQGKSQGDGQQNMDQPGEQDGDASDKGQSAQNRPGDKSADKPGNQDSKSGVGKQDGDKSVRDAEQLAAMGRISELLGKRSAQLTGEMTVEVPSGKQQLKTAYSQKKAAHMDAGGEVNRDEIPLIYQPYVQRYFEEVRKTQGKVKN